MGNTEEGHRERGLLKLLAAPRVYALFADIVGRKRTRLKLVRDYLKPFPGCRILDIGCGTANIVSLLPDSVGEYVGFDMNGAYIEHARKRWSDRSYCRFFCQRVDESAELEAEHFDAVLAAGIVHHLNDDEAWRLFHIAYRALKVNGALTTYDNVYVENQSRLARWFISRDRGQVVRTVEGYKRLAAQYFEEVEGDVLHDALKIPYTILIMKCHKSGASGRSP